MAEQLPILNSKLHEKKEAPIRVLQFGEGNFLRAFIDWMIQQLNDRTSYEGHVCVVQPLPSGRVKELAVQDGLYTVILQGLNEEGKAVKTHQVIDVLDDFVNPYTEYEKYLKYGESKDLEVIISNTTEAGIAFDEADISADLAHVAPASYPGKLYALLERRYQVLGKEGEIAIMPCELIDDNGDKLKEVLLKIASGRKASEGFIDFINHSCHFTSSLVDRIVPGFPRDEFDTLCKDYGYIDNNMVKGEYFNLLVYRKEEFCEKVFPLHQIGEPVHCIYADDVHPYKQRKVRCLNGTHSSLVPVAYLAGFNEVRESLEDSVINEFITHELFEEIVPTVKVKDVEQFAKDVFKRFLNPYVHHQLMSIALNSIPKFKERDLPTILDSKNAKGEYPRHLMFALASLIRFYKGYRFVKGVKEDIKLADSAENIAFFKDVWAKYDENKDVKELAHTVLSNSSLWDQDLTKLAGFEEVIVKDLELILSSDDFYAIVKGFDK